MKVENEVRILEINQNEFENKLESLGAKKVGVFFQKRYVYDVKPFLPNKWIRLRTNGEKTTLTIKEVVDKTQIGGTIEKEIEVSDFEETNRILEDLGYYHRNYEENKRTIYIYENIEVSIDKWPLIPAYAEIEGQSEEDVKNFIEHLNMQNKITTLDVNSIYKDIYGIDMLKIKDLREE